MGFWRKNQITFLLTSKCNLNCVYCYMPKMKNEIGEKIIDLEFAITGLKDFLSKYNSKNIRFFSPGEPTEAFQRMKDIKKIADELIGDDLTVELESNGYFNGEIKNWIENNVTYFWISCDGPPQWQFNQRLSKKENFNYETIYENIEYFANSSKLNFGVSATLAPKNISNQIQLIEFFNTLGVKYVCSKPIYYSEEKPNLKAGSLVEFAKYFVPAFYRAKELDMFYQTLLTVNFDEEVDIYCQAHLPSPRLTPDGYVSCCDWASFGPHYLKSEVLKNLIYGYYDSKKKKIVYDYGAIEKIQSRNVDVLNNMSCKNCKVLKHCAGGCVGKMSVATNDFYKATTDWCKAVKYLYNNLPVNQSFPFLHP